MAALKDLRTVNASNRVPRHPYNTARGQIGVQQLESFLYPVS